MFNNETVDKIFALCVDGVKKIVQKAIELALDRHSGQFRIDGEPYVNHVLRVGAATAEFALKKMPEQFGVFVAAAILHDILEDTPTTDEELREKFGEEVTRIVRALSHEQEEEPDEVYLARIVRGGKLAVLIKRFDRLDNISSLAEAPDEFREKKLVEVQKSLSIWQRIDPEGAVEIKKALENLEETE